MSLRQFEIYNIDLNPTKGSEQSGIRTCLILQTNGISDLGNTTVIAIFTTKKLENIYPYEVFVGKNSINGLREDSKLKLNQIRVIDKSRIIKKLGFISDKNIQNDILLSLDILFDRNGDFR